MKINKTLKINDLCDILNGYAFKSDKYVSEGIRVIRITNVQKGFVEDTSPAFYPNSEENKIKDYLLYENDLLVSLTGNVGRVALLEKQYLPAALNQRVACLRIKDQNLIHIKYLFTYLNSEKFENDCIFSAKGIAQKNMSTEWLKHYEIPVPEMNKQIEIYSNLEKVSEIINNHKALLSKYDILIKSRFIEMFGDDPIENGKWKVEKLGNVCSKITDGTHKTPSYQHQGITFISAKNIIDGKIDLSDVKHITKDEYAVIQKRCNLEKGDVLLTKSGSLGSTAIFNLDIPVGLFESLAILKYDKNLINGVFLKETLQCDSCKRQFANAEKGIAIKHLHLNVISNTRIPVPPLELQQQFADFVQQIDKSKFEYDFEEVAA